MVPVGNWVEEENERAAEVEADPEVEAAKSPRRSFDGIGTFPLVVFDETGGYRGELTRDEMGPG